MNFEFALSVLCCCLLTHARGLAVQANSDGSSRQHPAAVEMMNRLKAAEPKMYVAFEAAGTAASPFMSFNLLANLKRRAQAFMSVPEQVETPHLLQQPTGQVAYKAGPGGGLDAAVDPGRQILYAFFSACVFASLVIIVAYFYDREKKFPPEIDEQTSLKLKEGEFQYGLFSCFDNFNICLFSCCCMPIRWADTIRMIGFLPFYAALFIFLGCIVLDAATSGIASLILLGICTYYRQKIRSQFGMPSGDCGSTCVDCLTYACCGCCAIIQEARQVEEAYLAKHPAVEGLRVPV